MAVLKLLLLFCLRYTGGDRSNCSLVWNIWGTFIDSNTLLDYQKKPTEVSDDFAFVTGELNKVLFHFITLSFHGVIAKNVNKFGKE